MTPITPPTPFSQTTFSWQAVPLFHSLEENEFRTLSANMVRQQFSAGSVIFHEGDPGRVLYLLESGQVRIFILTPEGMETSVILCGKPGDIFGELAVVDELPRSATALAITDTVVYTLNRELFSLQMRRMPQLALNFMRLLTKRLRYNTQQVDSFTSMDVSRRLARKLLELAQDCGTVETIGVRLNTPLTQSDLASLIGATRESTNKVLRAFRKDGLITTQNGHIFILDADALRMQVSYSG